MTVSVVSICNRALDTLGADPITSLDDPQKAARLCNRNFTMSRDAVLRAYPWNCAMARASLAASTDVPAFGFARYFPVPDDFLRMWRLQDDDEGVIKWRLEGRRIATDAGAPLLIVYASIVTDPAQFDSLLVDALSARLAADIAYTLIGSMQAQQNAWSIYQAKLAEARQINAQEQGVPDEFSAPDWIDSRI